MGARGIGFLSHLFGLISAPCLQAKVNFMPGQGVFMLQEDGGREGSLLWATQQFLSEGGSIAAKYEP